jgi:hypothetical protein
MTRQLVWAVPLLLQFGVKPSDPLPGTPVTDAGLQELGGLKTDAFRLPGRFEGH